MGLGQPPCLVLSRRRPAHGPVPASVTAPAHACGGQHAPGSEGQREPVFWPRDWAPGSWAECAAGCLSLPVALLSAVSGPAHPQKAHPSTAGGGEEPTSPGLALPLCLKTLAQVQPVWLSS